MKHAILFLLALIIAGFATGNISIRLIEADGVDKLVANRDAKFQEVLKCEKAIQEYYEAEEFINLYVKGI